MAHEIAIFWAVLFGFLVADNLVLLPRGGDYLRLGRGGHLLYEPATRLEARGRDLVMLNPLNPFGCVLVASRSTGPASAADWRQAFRQAHAMRRGADALARIGSAYLVFVVLMLALSLWLYFGIVLLMLLAAHLIAWACASHTLYRHRNALRLTRQQAWGLIAEALFVPAHTASMGKRAVHRHTVDLPALALGLHRLRRMGAGPDRELFAHHLQTRLDDLADAAQGQLGWIQEARRCLMASTPPAGS